MQWEKIDQEINEKIWTRMLFYQLIESIDMSLRELGIKQNPRIL